MRVCCICGREPKAFETDQGDVAWFIFSWKGDQGLCHLMSDGTICYGVALERDPDDERFDYYCIECVENLSMDEEDDE